MTRSRRAAQHAAGLRTAQRLAAGEGHEVGAVADEAPEIGLRRQLSRGIDDHGDLAAARQPADVLQRRLRGGIGHIENGRRLLGDRVVDLPGFGIAHAGTGIAVGQAHFDDRCSRRADGVVVEIALAAHHDHVVAHAAGVGKPRHAAGIEPGDAGRSGDQQAGRGAGGHVARLRARGPRDHARGRGLKFGDVDTVLRGLDHGGGHLRRA